MKEAAEQNSQFNPESEVKLTGRVLWLTKDPETIHNQIKGTDLQLVPITDTKEDISTDSIIRSRFCFYSTPEQLGEHALEEFMGVVSRQDIKNGNFQALIANHSFAQGSAREHAPIALKGAGIKFVFSPRIERIFLQNAINIGLLPIQDEEILKELLTKRSVNLEMVAGQFDPISADIIRFGGLLPYLKARLEGKIIPPEPETPPRPMTIAEKIIAAHWVKKDGSVGVPAVKPGDAGFVKADFCYSYEIMTPLAEAVLKEQFGDDFPIVNKENIALFEDHLTLFETKAEEKEEQELQALQVSNLISTQRKFAKKYGILRYNPDVGICHNKVAESHALPGQVIDGTDSHTCSEGVVGAFANGIGATEMAGSWLTGDVRVKVPATWRFNFEGKLSQNVMAKDVMLYIFTKEEFQKGQAVRKVLEYGGEALRLWSFDELFVLPNMAVEGGAFTGIVEPNEVVINFLLSQHPELSRQQIESMIVKSDPSNKIFEEVFDIDLSKILPMVALPGNPKNGVPVRDAEGKKIDVVYIGSCTGGKLEDLIAAAIFLEDKKVKVPTYIQASSLHIRNLAEGFGLFQIFREAGATIIDPGCGDCCNLGFGITEPGGNVCSDTNRNFPGRMGDNNVHLVNPAVAAATAVTGYLTTPDRL